MEIYLLSQDINNEMDSYDSVVVIADNEGEAIKVHPNLYVTHVCYGAWMGTRNNGQEYKVTSHGWVEYDQIYKIKVQHIGSANSNAKKGVVLASYG